MYAAKLLCDAIFRQSFTFNSYAAKYNDRIPEGFKIHVYRNALETFAWKSTETQSRWWMTSQRSACSTSATPFLSISSIL